MIEEHLKYLGIIFDKSMTFRMHCEHVANKAAKTMTALNKLLPNLSGPTGAKRALLISVCKSIICYAAPVWGAAMGIKSYAKKIEAVWRRAVLRAISGYRTVSKDAADAVGGQLPICYEIMLRTINYNNKKNNPVQFHPKENRDAVMDRWQQERTGCADSWHGRLIPDIKTWAGRKHGQTNYHITQALTRHGAYNAYLSRFKVANSEMCLECDVPDTVEHAVFRCNLSKTARENLNNDLGCDITVANMCKLMCESPAKWKIISDYIVSMMHERTNNEKSNGNATLRTINDS